MNRFWTERILQSIGVFILLAAIAVGVGSFLGCLSWGAQLNALPLAAVTLGFFTVFDLWWLILGFSIWIIWFPPRELRFWMLAIFAAVVAGFAASWRFQVVRPWDIYHEADGSQPGWEPIRMESLTTIISCASAVISVALSAYIFRRSMTSRT